MAKLHIFNDQVQTEERPKIASFLKSQGIEFGTFDLSSMITSFTVPDSLSEQERKSLIDCFPEVISSFSKEKGYRSDVVCFYPTLHDLDLIIQKFGSIHYHFENEYWYFIDGEACFGFLGSSGTKFELLAGQGEYLQVPEGCWQWFSLTPTKKMKAVRFFYTNQTIPARVPVVL